MVVGSTLGKLALFIYRRKNRSVVSSKHKLELGITCPLQEKKNEKDCKLWVM